MKYKKIIAAIMISIMSFILIGCSGKESNSEKIGDGGVVATSVAVTEIIDSLGVELVGVPKTAYSLPESTKYAVEVGAPMSPDLEVIKSLNPTIVVSVDTLGSDYMNLFTENNIPSEFVSLESLENLKESISKLGDIFNKKDEAKILLEIIVAKEDKFKNNIADKDKSNVLILFAAPGSTMIATPKSYIGNLVELVGGNNIIKDSSTSFIVYNKEELTLLNPDKILVMTHAMPKETKAALEKEMETDSTWQRINAVKEGRITYLDNEYFGMSANLKVVDGLDILNSVINGDGE